MKKPAVSNSPPDDQTGGEHLQPSVILIVIKLLASLFIVDTLYALLLLGFLGLNNVHQWHTAYVAFLVLVHTIKYLIVAGFVIQLFTEWAGRAYYLSGHHLVERIGLVNITETTHELSQVKSVVMSQTWMGRHFNFGTIRLSFAGSGKEKVLILRSITNPGKYKKYFDEHLQVQGWVR